MRLVFCNHLLEAIVRKQHFIDNNYIGRFKLARSEVMVKMRSRYRTAGFKYRAKLIDQAVEVFDYHRKSPIRALGALSRPALPRPGRPPKYDSAALQPALSNDSLFKIAYDLKIHVTELMRDL